MKRVVIFGNSKMTEEATRNSTLCHAFEICAEKVIHNTIDFGFAKPDAPPFFKIIYAFLFAFIRWVVLFTKYLSTPPHDIIYVPYPSYMDGWLACILGKIYNKIVIIDSFLGIYDTIVCDRNLLSKEKFLAKLIWYYEKFFLSLANIVLVDTEQNGKMLKKLYTLPRTKILSIPVGIDENLWKPIRKKKDSSFTVFFWCTFIPLHGAEVVAYSAQKLMELEPSINFLVVGTGQDAHKFSTIIKELNLNNLTWIKQFISLEKIYNLLSKSNCCLGIFGNKEKTQRVIPYKVYQALSSSQPVITATTEATQQILSHGKNALLIPPNDPSALTNAILTLKADKDYSERIAINGRKLYEEKLSNNVIANKISKIFKTSFDESIC